MGALKPSYYLGKEYYHLTSSGWWWVFVWTKSGDKVCSNSPGNLLKFDECIRSTEYNVYGPIPTPVTRITLYNDYICIIHDIPRELLYETLGIKVMKIKFNKYSIVNGVNKYGKLCAQLWFEFLVEKYLISLC